MEQVAAAYVVRFCPIPASPEPLGPRSGKRPCEGINTFVKNDRTGYILLVKHGRGDPALPDPRFAGPLGPRSGTPDLCYK